MATTPTSRPTNGGVQPSRMTLATVRSGRRELPLRTLLYGAEGVGKTTFAACAPRPIFLAAEDGTAHLDVPRFPTPETWTDVLDAIRTLATEAHDYQTVVIDTLDAVEPLVWRHVCARDKQDSIESYGYGKGYVAALDEWRVLLAALERLRAIRTMNVVLIAHTWLRPFKNPEGPDFDRYEMKLHPKAGGQVKEWCDDVLFARFETYAAKDERTKRIRGVSTGARIVCTVRTAAYDAKNRHSLPETLPLSWEDYAAALAVGAPADPATLADECRRKAAELGGEVEAFATTYIATHPAARDLARLNDRLNAKLAERAASAPEPQE